MQKSRLLLRERISPLTYLFLTAVLFLTMIFRYGAQLQREADETL